ncbi:MAG: DUF1367 family protein [Melioribacteraceae bacterium]|jgi:hypothetical protein|nr:DUF1367 family protein [Melioribacteraceae bacterium]
MEFFAQISNRKLLPEYESDNEQIAKLKSGTTYKFVVTSPRNIKFHRLFFALVNLCYENQSKYTSADDLRAVLTMKAGYYKIIRTDKGAIYLPESISFASMDELKFKEVYSKVLDEVVKMIGSTSEEIEKELINFF